MDVKEYSTKEFAQALGISKNHLLKMEAEGKVPPAARCQRGKILHRRYVVEDIVKYREILQLPPIIKERRVQVFLNFKGGTGKSTLSSSYAYAIAELGVYVLAIDLDAQQHMTTCLGVNPGRTGPSAYDVLVDNKNINEVIVPTSMPTLDLIPASVKLSVLEHRLPERDGREFLLKTALSQITKKDYKIIVIDSLPNVCLLNKNAILASDDLLVPVLPDYLSYDGLGLLFEELSRMDKAYAFYTNNYRHSRLLDHIYVIVNQYRSNEVMSKQNRLALETYYSQYLCETYIPYSTKLAQCTAAGMPIFQYNRACAGARHLQALVEEILGLGPNHKIGRKKRKNAALAQDGTKNAENNQPFEPTEDR